MKKLIFLLTLLTLFISCKKDPEQYLETSLNSLNFQPTGGEQSFNISTNLEWRASFTTMSDWITINPSSGIKDGVIHLVVKENNNVNKRTLTLILTAETLKKNITISQEEAPAIISTDKTSENINSTAGTFAVEVTTNGASWTTSGVPAWITLTPANGSASANVTATYQANTQAASRNATITFTSGTSSKTLTITQAAATATLNLDKTSENINSVAGSFAVEVTTNGASWTTSGVPNWITLSPANGSTSGQVTISYQSNAQAASRNATITFTFGTSSKSLTITQAAATATLNIDKTSENVNSAAGSFAVGVTTNGASWTTSGVPNWITINPANGSSSGNVTANYQANTLAVSRTATINFTSGSSSKYLTVTQAAANAMISLDKTTENVSSTAGSLAVEVTTNGSNWTSGGVPNWITLSPASGSSSGNVTANYQANALAVNRTATITFTSGSSSKSLTVTQAAATPVLQINVSKKQVGYQAGSVLVELTINNAEWKISGLPAWISASPMQGDKSETITINYQANTLNEKRSANIIVSSGSVSKTLVIEQLTALDANDGGNW